MTVTRSRTRSNYDRLSRWYDLLAGASERACRDLGLRKLDVQPGERVLEIGSGTGQALQALRESAGPSGAAWGLDLSPGMCRVARRNSASRLSDRGPLMLACGDATALPVAGQSMDAIFMSFTLELFSPTDMTRVLAECVRVLAKGGRLAVVALADEAMPGAMQRAYAWAHGRFPAWIDCRPIKVVEILSSQGFRVRDVTRKSLWGLAVDVVVAHAEEI